MNGISRTKKCLILFMVVGCKGHGCKATVAKGWGIAAFMNYNNPVNYDIYSWLT